MKTFRIACYLLFLVLLLSLASMGLAQEETEEESPPQVPGRVTGTGTYFEVTDGDYPGVSISSSESIWILLESEPAMITLFIEPVTTTPSAEIVVSGLLPHTTYYKYQDNEPDYVTLVTGADGTYTFTQDLTSLHLVTFQINTSTYYIRDNATGGHCTLIGEWYTVSKTCKLTRDISDTIRIDGDGITLDGNGHRIVVDRMGVTAYLRNGLTVKNLSIIVTTRNYAISAHTLNDFTIENVDIVGGSNGGSIWYFRVSGGRIADSEISAPPTIGINVEASDHIVITNNHVYDTPHNGIFVRYSNNIDVLHNDVSDAVYNCIYIARSSTNTIVDNALYRCKRGVHLESRANDNVVHDNDISENSKGLHIQVSSNNLVYHNNFFDNGIGLHIEESSNYNLFYHNSFFLNNTVHIRQDTTTTGNTFNRPAPDGGNWFDTYDEPAEGCNNLDGDSFCDDPYIFITGQDNLPWTEQSGWANSPPMAEAGGPYTAGESESITLDASGSTDPDDNIVSYEWDLDGDGDYDDASGVLVPVSYQDNGIFTVGLLVIDESGESNTDTATVTVANVPPNVTANETEVTVDEGKPAANDGTFFDPGDDIVTVSASIGAIFQDVGNSGTWSWSFDTSDGPDDSQLVIITATDSDGAANTVSFQLNVNNVAPSIVSITAPLDPVNINELSSAPISVAFSDPAGIGDVPYSCAFDFDNDDNVDSTVTASGFSCAATPTYTEPGVYTVLVTVSDEDGDYDGQTYAFVVVYDPFGGFVTGGGWIWSEAGWCLLDEGCAGAEGKANFGFVSKYKKGAAVPSGNTEFNFKAGGLNFHSSSYDWLVIAGANAKYKGVGTINGQGEYRFMLTATDGDLLGGGQVDTFRIKIWDDNGVVYDNKMGEDADSYNGTELGGGNIKVHMGK